jgi:hypothetical protein
MERMERIVDEWLPVALVAVVTVTTVFVVITL